ncbi:alpha/beta hydrolase [Clostridiaceae bacterium M8S5]|nr:alpha/beta hydrolase [Clostridiaceae bacterium M8S5]
MSNFRNDIINLGKDEDMYYVSFGSGDKQLVIIPGLSDGLVTVKGKGRMLAKYYKIFAKDFRVTMFSRKNQLKKGYTIRDMAHDQKRAMAKLGMKDAYVYGISQGGMISQCLAIDYPDMVKKLVIGVSISRQNPYMKKTVENWIRMAKDGRYGDLIEDTIKRTYTKKKMKRYKFFMPIIKRIGKPKSFERFLIQAEACLTHNAYDKLSKIKCLTLVIGGDSDRIVGLNTSEEMAEKIPNSKLIIYKGLGHGAYEEEEQFHNEILKFLLQST